MALDANHDEEKQICSGRLAKRTLAPRESRYKTLSRSAVLLGDTVAKGGRRLSVVNVRGRNSGVFPGRIPRRRGVPRTRQIDTIRSMRKEEFERRAAEMKARMLAQRNRQAEEPSAAPVRKSRAKVGHQDSGITVQSSDTEVQALQKRVKELEAENLRLRQQLTAIANRTAPPSQSSADSVREQRHNFFKYSNVRRY